MRQCTYAALRFSSYLLVGGLYKGQVAGLGSCGCPWTTLLSSPTALEWLPVLGMGLWTGTKSLPPQMLLSGQILCQLLWDGDRQDQSDASAMLEFGG